MSGYKRVNFYELCRLCATNQQKEKTHIFQEEGRKIQLQNKIQSCLSLKVCENDFLPKVVCSQCLRSLEECCIFRKECYTSETMLSSYFNNFRYTEDFKKSGKVYIKDTSPKVATENTVQTLTNTSNYNVNLVSNVSQDNLPYYTLQLPAPVMTQTQEPKPPKDQKVISQPQIKYNVQTVVPNTPRNNIVEPVAINSNGEIITIAPLVDVDTLITQKSHKKNRKHKMSSNVKGFSDAGVIKIDLTQSNFELKEKLKLQQNKVAYTVKVDDYTKSMANLNFNSSNQSVILNSTCLNFNGANPTVNVLNSNGINIATEIPDPSYKQVHYSHVTNSETKQDNVRLDCNINITDSNIFTNTPNPTPIQPFPNLNMNGTFTTPNQSLNGTVKKHSCDVCCKTFKRREHLYQHVKLHTGFRPFKCDNCNKSFMRKEHLLRHMTSHSGQKNFTCTICEKSFSRNDNLLKHKKIHNKQNSFTCEVCQKQFVMEHYYFAHKRVHDNEKCNVNQQVWGMLKAM